MAVMLMSGESKFSGMLQATALALSTARPSSKVAAWADAQQPAVQHPGGDADDWRVQIFRYPPRPCISKFQL